MKKVKKVTYSGEVFADLFKRVLADSDEYWDYPANAYTIKITVCTLRCITLARLFHDGEFLSAGIAVRTPEDTYNFMAGARIAVRRALDNCPYEDDFE